MLSLVLASFFALAQDETPVTQDPAPEHHCPCIPSYSAALRAGGWWMGGFDAVTPAGRRQIDSTLFFDAGLDLEVERLRWTLSLSGDYAIASDVRVVHERLHRLSADRRDLRQRGLRGGVRSATLAGRRTFAVAPVLFHRQAPEGAR